MNADDILLEVIRIARLKKLKKLDLRTVKDYKLITRQKDTPNRKELEGKYVYIKTEASQS